MHKLVKLLVVSANLSLAVNTYAATPPVTGPASTYASLPMIDIKVNGQMIKSYAYEDRIRLSKEAAASSNLKRYGLDWTHLYAIVNAESDWSPRDAMGKNGKASMGLAQLEAATARSLKVNPFDTKEALRAVAALLKEATAWAHANGHLKDSGAISVYYNLSTRARNAWDGDALSLPPETQRHIINFKQSRLSAAMIERRMLKHQGQGAIEKRMAGYKPRRLNLT